LPGMLTAIAGIVSAIASLIVALSQIAPSEGAKVTDPGPATLATSSPVDARLEKAKALARKAFVISPRHISARDHLESQRPRICVGSEIEDIEWRNLLRAYRLKEEIAIWSLSPESHEQPMTDSACLLTLFSSEQTAAASRLLGYLNEYGDDPPYRIEAFDELFQEWEIGFE